MGRVRPKYMCEQCRVNSTVGRKPGILIPDLYFYDVKYKPILSQIERKKIKKNKIMGQTRPKCMGWVGQAHLHGLGWRPSPSPNGLVTVHQHSNQPTLHFAAERELFTFCMQVQAGAAEEENDRGAGGYLGRRRGGSAGGGGAAVAVVPTAVLLFPLSLCFFLFFPPLPLLFLLPFVLFFFFLLFLSSLYSLSIVQSFPFSLPFFFFFGSLPLFL